MARVILGVNFQSGTSLLKAGTVLDDKVGDPIDSLRAAGAVLIPATSILETFAADMLASPQGGDSNFAALTMLGQAVGFGQTPTEPVVINVKSFGAVGDGVADDSRPIQNAIDSLPEVVGGVVLFPAGIYKCDASLSVTKDRVYLFGNGKAILYFKPSESFIVDGGIAPAVNQYFTATNIAFSRVGALGTGAVLKIKRAAHVRIIDCDFAAGDKSLWLDDVSDAIVRGCFFGELCSENLLYLTNCISVAVLESYFENDQPGSGANIELGAANYFCTVSSCRFNDGSLGIRAGVGGIGLFNSSIVNNTFTSSCLSGISMAGGGFNTIVGNALRGSGGAGTGISLSASAANYTVFGNTVTDYATASISDAGGTNGVIAAEGGAFSFQGGGAVTFAVGVDGKANALLGYKVAGIQVLTAQQAAVANATDATSVIARLNDLLAALRTHGLIAT